MVYFPRAMTPKGEIHFYRASDASLDKRYSIQPDTAGIQFIEVQNFEPGFWTVKVDWTSDGLAYYMEEDINIH